MRANIEMSFNDELTVPIDYNYILHEMILNCMGKEGYETLIHDKRYEYKNRSYKLFTFSKLFGKFEMDKENSTITYFDRANFTVSSPDYTFLNYLINRVLKNPNFKIGWNDIKIKKIENFHAQLGSSETIYTKSPIVAYKTLENDKRRKTLYYSPYEDEFQEILKENLINKYKAIYGYKPEHNEFKINVLETKKPKSSSINYQGHIIKGWNGEFLIEGSPELLQIAYDTGLGLKNSQGFGCIEVKEIID
ncbi:CRISPR-associated endoribonuclease Cas6 [Clostridium peptidivorans]|uniref:CRISPR-associated endoribonuclease Cas6 n=1 Tax=Clostridium peptidivorans TaxID=100174 RepID=UPI0015C7C1DC|nr:CRISPR-associated endoribonuclease Cas6 [Clostridium peptidivorans]